MACENKIEILENTLLKLIVRNGTNNERVNAVLTNGELGYTTDTKRLWVGDGVTGGGSVVGNLFRGCVADQAAVNAITDSVEGDIVYNIANGEISVWENGVWKVISAPGGGGTTVTIVDNNDGTLSIDGNCVMGCDAIVDNNDGTATIDGADGGEICLLTCDSQCNTTPQTLTFSNPLVYDNSNGQNAILNLTGDTNLNSILNIQAGDQGILTVIQKGTTTPFALGSSLNVITGDLADITNLPENGVAKIAWETHTGNGIYLWVSILD